MKMVVNENERGFLFENGRFKKFLQPGIHYVWGFLGQKAEKERAEGAVARDRIMLRLMMENEDFAASVISVSVPDGHIALHRTDGRIAGLLPAGEYYLWNIRQKHTFELLDISKPDTADIAPEIFLHIPQHFYTRVEVAQGECALLYFDGAFQRVLGSGSYYFWNCGIRVTFRIVDLRVQQLEVPGQEILTADKVSLRINFLCRYRVADAVKAAGELKDFTVQIYSAVQLALRRYVGKYRLDELLEQREEIAGFILEKLKAVQEALYVEFREAGIRDIILPGEIRDIMNTVLVAEKSAQANVIARREEVASTRSLLNTAKLLDENETLRRLKEMEYLERICDKVGSISLSSGGGLLSQLGELAGIRRTDS